MGVLSQQVVEHVWAINKNGVATQWNKQIELAIAPIPYDFLMIRLIFMYLLQLGCKYTCFILNATRLRH